MITFTIPTIPVPKGRPRFFRGIAVTPPKTRRFEKEVRNIAYLFRPEKIIEGPITMLLVFVMPMPKKPTRAHPHIKPDIDNLIKAITDSLNGIIYKDDSQIVEVFARKIYDHTHNLPRIVLSIEEIK